MDPDLRQHLLRPRHIAASLLVLFLCGGITGGLVAVASTTASADPAASAPEGDAVVPQGPPFVLAAAQIGDRGVYETQGATMGFDSRGIPPRDLRIAFELRGAGWRFGVDGNAHWSKDVSVQTTQGYDARDQNGPVHVVRNESRVVSADAVSGASVQSTSIDTQRSAWAEQPGLLPLQTTNASREVVWSTTWFGPGGGASLPCGLVNPFQGNVAPAIGVMTPSTEDCDWWTPTGPLNPNAVYTVVTALTESSPRTMWVDYYSANPSSAPQADGRPDWRAVYREDVAYPLRMEGRYVPTGPDQALVLTHFQAGGAAMSGPDSIPPVLPPLVEKPHTTPVLLDDTGVDHQFPLSAAFQYALTDATHPELARFMAAHPQAYVAWARHAEFDMDGDHAQRWSMGITDGQEAPLNVTLSQHTTSGNPLVPGLPALPGSQPVVSYAYETPDSGPYPSMDWPTPDRLPAAFPTVSSLLQQWQTVSPEPGNKAAGPSWQYAMLCVADDAAQKPCATVTPWWTAGKTYYYRVAGPGYPVVDNRLDVWDVTDAEWRDGTLVVLSRTTQADTTRTDGPVTPPTMPGPTEGEGGPVGTAASILSTTPSPLLLVPTAAQAAGIGGTGLLAGLLYWLWPVVRSSVVGLFSRVQGQRLLEHPVRASIVQLIEAEPGIHQKEIGRRLGKGHGTIDHHLAKLTKENLVRRQRGRGFTCYFPRATDARAMAAAPVLKSPVARAVASALHADPQANLSQIARELDVAVPTVHYHAMRLRQAGVVQPST